MARYRLSGSAWHLIVDSAYGQCGRPVETYLERQVRQKVLEASTKKVGRGFSAVVDLEDIEAEDLADYLDGYADVNAGMSAEERDGCRDGRVASEAARRLRR